MRELLQNRKQRERRNQESFLREFERNEICDQRKGLGSLYSEMDGPDHSKMIVSNDWDEDLGRFGIKNRIPGDLVHESVLCKKSIDHILRCRKIDRSH
jgi:hypothetical protein